jgi:hypothetical protein
VSRGVVLWPDNDTSDAVRALWRDLEACGLPSLLSHTHGLHAPHLSLTVAEQLPVAETLAAVGPVPTRRIPLLVEAIGVFPEGALFLAVVTNESLLSEQHRVHRAVRHLAESPWAHFDSGTWTPHITCAWSLDADQLRIAVPRALERLPIRGWLDRGGVEDGTTGEQWPAPTVPSRGPR